MSPMASHTRRGVVGYRWHPRYSTTTGAPTRPRLSDDQAISAQLVERTPHRGAVGRCQTQRTVDALARLDFVDAPRDGQLGDQRVSRLCVHRGLGGRQRGVLLAPGKVAHDFGAFVHVTRLQLLLVVLEPS